MSNWTGSGIFETEVERDVICDAEYFSPGYPEANCGFDGTVEVHVFDSGAGEWECPRCGASHSMDRDEVYPPRDDY